MNKDRKDLIVIILIIGIFLGTWLIFKKGRGNSTLARVLIEEELESLDKKLLILQENSLLPISDPNVPEPKVIKKIKVIATAYSSTTWETDGNPFLTAAGTLVREGIVANNGLPIGTKIKIPELYGDKVFVVEDRMSWKKGKYQIDIWFPSHSEALNFGARRTYIEVLES